MSRLKIPNEWWTAPAESEDGQLILVTGRSGLEQVKATGFFIYRIEVNWSYQGDDRGMPDYPTSKLMEQVTDALEATFSKDPVAVNTGIYTGAGERNWVFYTRSLHIFQRKLNEILSPFETLPLTFHAEEDPDWAEYAEMCQCEVLATDD
ncbi:MAG: DUF695 domain-containing protein [Muribaculaceae bacterium]|nr:DUF695 domain-containing protein [Muribaculaceae bacterium]